MKEFWEKALLGPLETLSRSVLSVLPNVLAMSIILLVGLVAAWSIGHVVERLLRVIGLDHLTNRLGVNAALARGGVKADPSYLVGRTAYWLVVAFAILGGLGALNLQPAQLQSCGERAAGYLLSNFVSQAVLIAAVNAGIPPARLVAACSRWGVQLVAVAMALEQLSIAQNIVVVGFGIMFGGIVMAAAIAFGLGAKDLAKEFLEQRLSNKSRDRAPDDLRHL